MQNPQFARDPNMLVPPIAKVPTHRRLKIITIVGLLSLIIAAVTAYYYWMNMRDIEALDAFAVPVHRVAEKTAPESALFETFPNAGNRGQMVIDGQYLWIAGGHGLVRVDKTSGEQKIYTEADGLLGNDTLSIVKHGDEIWVASQSQGISILNTKTNAWSYFTTANGLVSDGNPLMKLDGDLLWLATIQGFAQYDFKTAKWTNWTQGGGLDFAGVEDFVFNANYVWIYVTPNAYTNGGVLRLDKQTLAWTDLQSGNAVFADRQLWNRPALYLDGEALYAVADKFIYHQDLVTGTWEKLGRDDATMEKFNIGSDKYNSLYWSFGKDGNIVTTDHNGIKSAIALDDLKMYCPETIHDFDFTGMEQGYDNSFNFDGNLLWFGCRQGLAAYDMTAKTWAYKATRASYPAEIYNILAVKNGQLLVDSNLGLGLADPSKQSWTFIKALGSSDSMWSSALWHGDDIYVVETAGAFGMGVEGPMTLWKYNLISATTSQTTNTNDLLAVDDAQNLWFKGGSYLQRYNIASSTIVDYKPGFGKGNDIKQVAASDNYLWFVVDGALANFDLATDKFELIGSPTSTPEAAATGTSPLKWSIDQLAAAGGQLWTYGQNGTSSMMFSYDPTAKTWRSYAQALKFQTIYSYLGTPNYLLAAMYNRVDAATRKRGNATLDKTTYEQYGLNAYDIAKGTWKLWSAEDGMLSGDVANMLLDGSNVWMVNKKYGVWKMDLSLLR